MDSRLFSGIPWPKKLRSSKQQQRRSEARSADKRKRRSYARSSVSATTTAVTTTPSSAHTSTFGTHTDANQPSSTAGRRSRELRSVIEQFPLPPAFPDDIVLEHNNAQSTWEESIAGQSPSSNAYECARPDACDRRATAVLGQDDIAFDMSRIFSPPSPMSAPTEGGFLGPLAGRFWLPYDRRISQGGEDTRGGRVIVDALVDDLVDGEGDWRVDEGAGEFNDVLGSADSLHPLVNAFVRAQIDKAFVRLGPEHVWLCVMQSLSAMVRYANKGGSAESRDGSHLPPQHSYAPSRNQKDRHCTHGDGGAADDLSELWRVLRQSSDVPSRCVASGREARLFASDMHGQHPMYSSSGAAPVAVAAAVAGHRTLPGGHGRVEHGVAGFGSRPQVWRARRQRHKNSAWMRVLANSWDQGMRGMCLSGSIQSWSDLCMLTRQLKEVYTGHAEFDWWLHRVHLLSRDLADYFAAQDEFAETHGVPTEEWQAWISRALFSTPSSASKSRMDGWLTALFSVDARGDPVHSNESWGIDWDLVPTGVDLQRVAVESGASSGCWHNLYSGFVGMQQLSRCAVANRSRTLHGGEELEAALCVAVRDCASTLTDSNENFDYSRSDSQVIGTGRERSASAYDSGLAMLPPTSPVSAESDRSAVGEYGHGVRAFAPLIGWALDKMHE
ncbi:hypothetical protein GQ54DRAFT_140765 [Martensiomyces pterosporus]|nr:hypothetical protein GQ54DRAFT_140765 [Martensiomyces pterosporus]